MPDDRFLHKRAGHSEKVSQLSDLEYRVWTQYLLSADDFGVMRYSGLTLQADNAALEERPMKAITAALNQIVSLKLLRPFYHQQRAYLYQFDWQDWQKITFPRKTKEPIPPSSHCSRDQQWLLRHHPGGCRLSSWKAPERFTCEVVAVFPEDFGSIPGELHKNSSEPLAVSHSREPLAVSPSPVPAAPPRPTPDELVRVWNTHREPGPKVEDLNTDRRKRYHRALETKPDLIEWELVIRWINTQPWANASGTGDHANWRATLDWLAKPGKVGEYLERARTDAAAGPRLISSAGSSTKAAAEIVKAAMRKTV